MLSQYDSTRPDFLTAAGHPRGGEVPYRAIEWERVTELYFESEFARSTYAIDLASEPDHYLGLRSRTFMVPSHSVELRCFMLCSFRRGVEIDPDRIATAELATNWVLYWFPDGSAHQCVHYNCPDVGRWVTNLVTGQNSGLMPATHALNLTAASDLT